MQVACCIDDNYQVVIVGGGWAGLTLARQLRRTDSELKILVLEANTEFSAKVGEATVELTGHYFVKRLGLVNYMYRNHLPKNGLRFFYDTPDHNLPLTQMSEHGTTAIPPHPAFQIDRAILERDLVKMNLDDGIQVVMGAKVTNVDLKNGDHKIEFTLGSEKYSVHSRWVIDASGRRRLITGKANWHNSNDIPKHASAWGRFDGVLDIDSMGDESWRSKAFGRFLSTIHFSGDGYWIWVIPLSGGSTSIGVVADRERVKSVPRKAQDFIQFLNQHRGLSQLLNGASLVDFESWPQLAYRANQFISEERWGATGFAAFFLDPLFSGGGDVIAVLNDLLHDIIIDDIHSDKDIGQPLPSDPVETSNKVAHGIYQLLYAHICNTYPILDCAELCSPVIAYNTAAYFIEPAWDYMAGNYRDLTYWKNKDHLRKGYLAIEKILQKQLLETVKILKKEDRYFRENDTGFFDSGADLYKYFVFSMGEKNRDGWRIDLRTKLWSYTFLYVTGVKLNLKDFSYRRIVQENLTFIDILNKPCYSLDDLPELLIKLSQSLADKLMEKFDYSIAVEITTESFATDDIAVQVLDKNIEQDELNKIQKFANRLWVDKSEYIEMPFVVPIFLKFCRGLDEDYMMQAVKLVEEELETA
ncbi:NAD(P)/FAD-dependent oxidoreductase [Pleionea sediminis]|uniref:NAD(P)/FAD-dependent oxidoreductase n=1 Tax=Pleionea sediminis TaxID=2569479 RepID=UPI0011855B41|nr:tryptophan 7-halogenase [Pleionea sediminis]